ncbi:MAG: polyprenyl synthetase family protein [Candidatus Sericytochromatia bacterium]
MEEENLISFFDKIKERILFSFKKNEFENLQTELLEKSFERYEKKSKTDLFSSSIFIFYSILKSYDKQFNEQAILLGSFCTLYIMSLDLFDDVQDNDLKGKPYEEIGEPIAINNAITLLFLALDFLTKAIELENDNNKKIKYLKIFNEASLLAVKGQHKDLMGENFTKTSANILIMQQEKASSISMIAKCAAIFSDCSDEIIKKYQSIYEEMILIFQIVDDVRDIYGKKFSPDLSTNKITYPIAIFLEKAKKEEILNFENLKKQLPNSLKDIRDLLYKSGTIKETCNKIESLRKNIHKEFASINILKPIIRSVLHSIDFLASSIYKIPILEESLAILKPKGELYNSINSIVDNFFINMKINYPKPDILPWQYSEFMYEPKRNIIFYFDIEHQSEEIIPIHSEIIGINDYKKVKELILKQIPFFMVHELFHYYRKASGKLCNDYWYEELVANSLAISYLQEFLPNSLQESRYFISEILKNKNIDLDNKNNAILENILNPNYIINNSSKNYIVDAKSIGLIQINMINKLLKEKYSLSENLKKFIM